jgi:hypothetical protein
MTPANREELVGMLTRGFATSGVEAHDVMDKPANLVGKNWLGC